MLHVKCPARAYGFSVSDISRLALLPCPRCQRIVAVKNNISVSPVLFPTIAGIGFVLAALSLVAAFSGNDESDTQVPTSFTSSHSSYSSPSSIYDDPRDARWDNPDGRPVIRAAAQETGASAAEVRRAFNDSIDRQGLSDWADER